MAAEVGRPGREPGAAAEGRAAPVRRAARGEAGYPERLRELERPPDAVYLAGAWTGAAPAVAVVGARDASPDGLDVARWLAAGLAASGVVVLSGLARGIDSAAHESALDAGGRSGAVLGTGIDRIYPPENADLTRRLRDSVGLLSELAPGVGGRRATFATRNRLLAALADVTVVVQGRARSGALITAREAWVLGRPVAAVPWDSRDPLGEAPHRLIRSGRATLVRGPEDVLDLLPAGALPTARRRDAPRAAPGGPPRGGAHSPGRPAGDLDPSEARLLAALRDRPQSLDVAALKAGLSAATAGAALVTLELRGLVRSGPGGLVRRTRRGG